MADLGTTTARTPEAASENGAPGRTVRRRRSLPGGRAVAGAFLVTAAAVGVFAAYLNATAAPSTEWLVAATDVAPGAVIEARGLDTVAIEVPALQREQLVPAEAIDRVVGRVALGPIRTGDLLQWTTVLAVEPPEGATTFTFALPSNRVAFRGDLAAGDRVDLVATYGDTTTYVARGIRLLAIPSKGEGATVTIAVEEPTTVLAIANALDTAQVFVVRSDPDAGDDAPAPFRPGSPRGEA